MKQSHWFLYVAKNCDWPRKNLATVKLDSSVASRRMENYSESRIELRNLPEMKKYARKTCDCG